MSTQLTQLYTFDPATATFSSGTTDAQTGARIEDTDTIKSIIEQELSDIFGVEEIDPATPMGRFVELLTMDFASIMRVNVQNANQLVISAAAGQQLDAIALWFGLKRKGAKPTVVEATLTGAEGTVVPAGARAKTRDGILFELVETVTLEHIQSLEVAEAAGIFRCLEDGPTVVAAGELVAIDSAYIGWNAVYNEKDGFTGRNVETDDALRERIDASRFSGIGFLGAMKNAIEAVDGVNSSMVIENPTDDELPVAGIDALAPHSIFVCADCAPEDFTAVAEAVFRTKPCGTGYTAFPTTGVSGDEPNTDYHEVVVTDAYGNPYSVKFHTPRAFAVSVAISVRNRSYTGADVASAAKSAIVAWAAEHEFKVGETVYASDIEDAVEAAMPGIVSLSCDVTTGGSSAASPGVLSCLDVPADAKAAFSAENITVSVVGR